MLLTLLLDAHWGSFGGFLARLFLGPFVLWITYRWVRRGLRLVKSEYVEEKKSGWAFIVLAVVVFFTFYLMSRDT
jgi:hypothetical protein